MTDVYENLANAIIMQAATDYRDALRILRYSPKDKDALSDKNSIERFFRSGWFGILTNLHGEILISRIAQEVRKAEARL